MLVRTQLMLEDTVKQELQEIAAFYDTSMSEKVREMIFENVKLEKVKIKKHKKIALSQAEALMKWASNPVSGPGDSDYDKYAYDF